MKRRTLARRFLLVAAFCAATVLGVALGRFTLQNEPESATSDAMTGFRFEGRAGSREQLVNSGGLEMWAECVGVADGAILSVSYRTLDEDAATSVSWVTARGGDYAFFDDDFDPAEGLRDLLGSGAEQSQGEFAFSPDSGPQTAVSFIADSNRPGGHCLFAGVVNRGSSSSDRAAHDLSTAGAAASA